MDFCPEHTGSLSTLQRKPYKNQQADKDADTKADRMTRLSRQPLLLPLLLALATLSLQARGAEGDANQDDDTGVADSVSKTAKDPSQTTEGSRAMETEDKRLPSDVDSSAAEGESLTDGYDDLLSMSLEELLDVQVVTASKVARP